MKHHYHKHHYDEHDVDHEHDIDNNDEHDIDNVDEHDDDGHNHDNDIKLVRYHHVTAVNHRLHHQPAALGLYGHVRHVSLCERLRLSAGRRVRMGVYCHRDAHAVKILSATVGEEG